MRWSKSSWALLRWFSCSLSFISYRPFHSPCSCISRSPGSAERACGASPWQRWPPCWCPAPLLGQWQRCCSRRLCCQSSSTTTCWKLSGKKKRESNMPSISKWGNTVIDARRRESCSLGGYESPWAPGGAIFIPGEIMTRREYWKPFFFTVKSFLEWASWWSQLPLGPNWHLQLLQLTTFGGTRPWAPGSAGVHPGERWTWLFLAWGFFVSLPHFNASSSPISFHSKVLTNEGHHTAAGTLGKDLVNRWSCSYMCPLGYSST